MMKKCNTCGETKSISEFYTKRYWYNPEDGRKIPRSQCKKCIDKKQQKNVVKYMKENPEKHQARLKVMRAIKNGELIKTGCIICGNKKSEGHHKDYSKPLEVVWLCSMHHKDVHFNRLKI